MNRSNKKITFLQLLMIMMLFNGLLSHVIVNPLLLDYSRRDAWISVILAGLVFIPWCTTLSYLIHKSGGKSLQAWLADRTHPFIAWMFIAPIIIQLYLIGFMTVTQTALWTVSNYLPNTPQFVLILTLIIVSFIAAFNGIRTIAICSGILLPIVAGLGYFVSFSNTSNKNWTLLMPIAEHGWGPILHSAIFAWSVFVELYLILLLQHEIETKIRTWHVMLLGAIIVYITLGPIVGAITEFGPIEAAKQLVSPYEQWRLVKIGNYIEHVDFLSVFQWLAGATIRVSLPAYLIAELLPLRTQRARSIFLSLLALSYIVLTMLHNKYFPFYLYNFEKYLIVTLAFTIVVTTIWAVIALFNKTAKGGPSQNVTSK